MFIAKSVNISAGRQAPIRTPFPGPGPVPQSEAEGWEGGRCGPTPSSIRGARLLRECLPCLLFKKGIGDTGYLPLPVRREIMRREAEVRGG